MAGGLRRFATAFVVLGCLLSVAAGTSQLIITDSSLSGNGSTASPLKVVQTVMQHRVTGTCTDPAAIVGINQDGTVTCSTSTDGGTGTTGTVALWTGPHTLGNSTITDISGTLTFGDPSIFNSQAFFAADVNLNTSSGATVVHGTLTANGNSNFGTAIGNVADFNGELTKFGWSPDGATFIDNNILGFQYATNATATGYINYTGYQSGATQFRDLSISDGKNGQIAYFTGSTHAVELDGPTSVINASGFYVQDATPTPTGVLRIVTASGQDYIEAGTSTSTSAAPLNITSMNGGVTYAQWDASGNQTVPHNFTSTAGINTLGDVVDNSQTVTTSSGAIVTDVALSANTRVIRWNATVSSPQIVGMVGGADGREVWIENVGSVPLTFYSLNGNELTAANQFDADGCTSGCQLSPKARVLAVYYSGSSKWLLAFMITGTAPTSLTVNGQLTTTNTILNAGAFQFTGGTANNLFVASQSLSSGNADISFDAAGTGTIKFNSNVGGIANSGTGGLALYGGANGSTTVWTVDGSGNQVNNGTLTVANDTQIVADAMTLGSSTKTYHVTDKNGTARPTLTACGTSPSVVGNDHSGEITVGTSVSACTLTFNTAYTSPSCVVSAQNGTPPQYRLTTTQLLLVTATAGQKYDYNCSDH